MKLNKVLMLAILVLSLPGYSLEPSELLHIFQQTFQHSVSESYPELGLSVVLSEKPDYMGGSSPGFNDFEISIGENTVRRLGTDTTVLILCHELGHLLAGKPFKESSSWIPPYRPSTEARSDYYAANFCAKEFFIVNEDIPASNLISAPSILTEKCEYINPNKVKVKLCERTAMAAYTFLLDVWSYLGLRQLSVPTFSDKARLLRINEAPSQYPTLQCRLDTFLAGDLNSPQPKCY